MLKHESVVFFLHWILLQAGKRKAASRDIYCIPWCINLFFVIQSSLSLSLHFTTLKLNERVGDSATLNFPFFFANSILSVFTFFFPLLLVQEPFCFIMHEVRAFLFVRLATSTRNETKLFRPLIGPAVIYELLAHTLHFPLKNHVRAN